MNKCIELIRLLANGEYHSGAELGKQLGITRAAIWKQINKIKNLDIPVISVKGRGYQIPGGLDLLDQNQLKQHNIEVFPVLDSTNNYLQDSLRQGNRASGDIATAEHMSNGRGRRGRHWYAPFGANIYMSIIWTFDQDPTELSGLSVAIAIGVADYLKHNLDIKDIKLKWPNDIYHKNMKLGGILVDILAESHSQTHTIIGLGLNVNMKNKDFIDLASICNKPISRNALICDLKQCMVKTLKTFRQQGFSAFIEKWAHFDTYYQQEITLFSGKTPLRGRNIGISERGELHLQMADGQIYLCNHGEISSQAT